jgi:hypothetical protein
MDHSGTGENLATAQGCAIALVSDQPAGSKE